jgi:hypothetical protein
MLGLDVIPGNASRQAGRIDPSGKADNPHFFDKIGVVGSYGLTGGKHLPITAL